MESYEEDCPEGQRRCKVGHILNTTSTCRLCSLTRYCPNGHTWVVWRKNACPKCGMLGIMLEELRDLNLGNL